MTDKYHDPKGGLSAEGRKKFKKSDGSNLKPGVKNYDAASTADKKRWVSWAKRFAGNPQPLKKDNGEPTNYALMFQAWGRPIPKSAADVKATYDLAVRRGKSLEKQSAMHLADIAAQNEAAAANPLNKKLYDEVVAAAKKKFKVYPSFYANSWVQQEYRKRGGKFAGGQNASVESGQPELAPEEQTTMGADPTRMRVADRPAAPEETIDPLPQVVEETTAPEPAQRAKAFVTEHAGKTLITGPATTIPGGFQKALNDNPHMLWLQGRLVGGETPNRNKALWTSGDLELGNATVAHGPLNWLHEARHVIGAIAGSNFIPAKPAGHGEHAAESVDPHIVAAASVWRWLYPDEAMVVEQASELNQLWYSMECVADSVVCAGDAGCGTEISYVDYCTSEKAGCEHIQARTGIRRFANPTFLGAAVIVPPTRPGWADADARVMEQASVRAEKAYEQAGEPDIATSDFERIVAQVLRFAE